MSYVSGRFKENHAALMKVGVKQEARYVHEDVIRFSDLEAVPGGRIQPAELAVRGLNRLYAVILFEELDRTLNVLSDESDVATPLRYMDETSLASIEREPIHIRTDVNSEFDILLQESAPGTGRFDLEVRRGPELDESAIDSRDTLHSAYNAIMN